MSAHDLLTSLLQDVSRSFYLTMRVLPASIRPQISLAYLLARTTDTIADTELVPVPKRLLALGQFRQRIAGKSTAPLDLGELAKNQGSPAEKVLLERSEDAFKVFATFTPEDQQRIREVLAMILTGQELDLTRFAHANEKRISGLQSDGELDGYTYRVAGCVGEFWTKMCRAHLFPQTKVDENFLMQNGVRFGKGLQLVNILRDLPRDLRQGRCYVPREMLVKAGLVPEDLLNPANEAKFRPVYEAYLKQAEAHLHAGWQYTNALPACEKRVRLACALPIVIGFKTIARLRAGAVLDPAQRIKVTRGEIWGVLIRAALGTIFPPLWKGLVK